MVTKMFDVFLNITDIVLSIIIFLFALGIVTDKIRVVSTKSYHKVIDDNELLKTAIAVEKAEALKTEMVLRKQIMLLDSGFEV